MRELMQKPKVKKNAKPPAPKQTRARRRAARASKPFRLRYDGVTCPPQMEVKLRYYDKLTLGGTFVNDQVYRGNSVFDPDFTGTGNQPTGFDQWAAFYNKYVVLKTEVKCQFVGTNTGNSGCTSFVVVPSSDSTTLVVPEDAGQMARALSKLTVGASVSTLRGEWWSGDIVGQSRQGVEIDDQLGATVSTNPGEVWYVHCYVCSMDGSTNLVGYMLTELTYTVLFHDPRQIQISAIMHSPGANIRRGSYTIPEKMVDDEDLFIVVDNSGSAEGLARRYGRQVPRPRLMRGAVEPDHP